LQRSPVPRARLRANFWSALRTSRGGLEPKRGSGMAWTYLFVAGLLEVVWAIGLKYTEGFTRLWPSVGTLAAMGASFYLLATALRTIPVGTGYAVWTGIGAVGASLLGMLILGEPRDAGRLLGIALIVCGIVVLRVA